MVDSIHLQIYNTSAAPAKKVVMGLRFSIKVFRTVSAANAECFAVLYQKIKIAVNGAEADIWKFLLYIAIYGFCGGMCRGRH
jgi:hypothetical protein